MEVVNRVVEGRKSLSRWHWMTKMVSLQKTTTTTKTKAGFFHLRNRFHHPWLVLRGLNVASNLPDRDWSWCSSIAVNARFWNGELEWWRRKRKFYSTARVNGMARTKASVCKSLLE